MKPRKLLASEVTFTVELEPEDIPVRGNVMCSDDPEYNKQCEDETIERLDTGHQEAWCYLLVRATWDGYTGRAGLGGVQIDAGRYPSGDKVARLAEAEARDNGLHEEALEDLQSTIEASYAKLAPLLDTDANEPPDSERTQLADHELDQSKHYWR